MALEDELEADPIRRLAVLGGENTAECLRLSRKEAVDLERLHSALGQPPAVLGYRLGAKQGRDAFLVNAAVTETGPVSPDALADIVAGSRHVFPVSAADLMPELQGAELGAALKDLERDWIDSDFALRKDQLIARLRG